MKKHLLLFILLVSFVSSSQEVIWRYGIVQNHDNRNFDKTVSAWFLPLTVNDYINSVFNLYTSQSEDGGQTWTAWNGGQNHYDYPDWLENMALTCKINNTSFYHDITIGGFKWRLALGHESFLNTSSLNINNNTGFNLPFYFKATSVESTSSTEERISNFEILCSLSLHPNLIVLSPTLTEIPSPGVMNISVPITVNYQRQLSVTQPAPISGIINRRTSSNITLTIRDAASNGLPEIRNNHIKWTISSPCSEWQPVLYLPSGAHLNPETDVSEGLGHGAHILNAKFTPTSLGQFTCTGTITVTTD